MDALRKLWAGIVAIFIPKIEQTVLDFIRSQIKDILSTKIEVKKEEFVALIAKRVQENFNGTSKQVIQAIEDEVKKALKNKIQGV
jgi:hypothetical protein